MKLKPTRRDFIRNAALAGTALAALPLLSSCGIPWRPGILEREDKGFDQGPAGGALVYAARYPYSIDPFFLLELSGIQIASLLFEPLVRYDYRQKRLLPAAARDWRISDKGRVFTFELAEGAQFHTGKPVTAYDFKYSWERLFRLTVSEGRSKPDGAGDGDADDLAGSDESEGAEGDGYADDGSGNGDGEGYVEPEGYGDDEPEDGGSDSVLKLLPDSPNAAYLMGIAGVQEMLAGKADGISGIRVVTANTLEITLLEPFFGFLEVLSFPAYAAVPNTVETRDLMSFAENPVGSGPFMMREPWNGSTNTLRLTRFDDYHGEPALLKSLDFRFYVASSIEETTLEVSLPGAAGVQGAGADEPPIGIQRAAIAGAQGAQVSADMPSAYGWLAGIQRVGRFPFNARRADFLPVANRANSFEENTYQAFEFGEVDVAYVPSDRIEEARELYGASKDGSTATPDNQVIDGLESSTYFLWMNLADTPLAVPEVRKAICQAINRQALCTEALNDTCSPATGIIPPTVNGFHEGAWAATEYDSAAARQILGDSVVADNPYLKTLTLLTYQDDLTESIFKMIKTDLEDVGFTVRIVSARTAEEYNRALNGNAALTISGWIADNPLMEDFLVPLFSAQSLNNESGYENPDFEAAVATARSVPNDIVRISAYQKADAIVAEDLPVIPLFYTKHNQICADRITDLYIAPNGIVDFTNAWAMY